MAHWSPVRQKRSVCVEAKVTDEEHIIFDELEAFMTRNETGEYLPFKKVEGRSEM